METRKQTIDKSVVDEATKSLIDAGKIIEAGWVGLAMMSIPLTAGDVQRREMRNAFFAGAQHLFSSIMSMLEPDAEPTENDMRRMDLISSELNEFITEYKEQNLL